ncbi:MAG TPA: helix-turn-helix domain-containing protein [Candidatus Saccharimonadales bacterium]|nr:helix-turn-helix domain-containing protein [Candidatus Saccharimonadales bacterium]
MNEQKIRSYLEDFGFEKDIIELYIALYYHGALTVSELSRRAGVERTRVYRLLDQLKEDYLIEAEIAPHRTLYRAAPITNLQILLTKKEQRLARLQKNLDSLEQSLSVESITLPSTSVKVYRGEEGMKQLFWNQTKVTSEVRVILHKNVQLEAGDSFFERWVGRFNERGVKSFGLIGDGFITAQKHWYASRTTTYLHLWEPRYISPSVFPITHNQTIYDDIVFFLSWQDGEAFGVEICNKEIADAHRYFFDAYWSIATPVNDITGERKA